MKSTGLLAIEGLLPAQHAALNASSKRHVISVLFEKRGLKGGQAIGRSPWLQPVHVENAADLIGTINSVRVADVLPNSLRGERISGEAQHRMVMY